MRARPNSTVIAEAAISEPDTADSARRMGQNRKFRPLTDGIQLLCATVAKCDRWQLSPSGQYIVGSGMAECDFSLDLQLALFEWLLDAEWLDADHVEALPSVNRLTDLLEMYGDIHWRKPSSREVQSAAVGASSKIAKGVSGKPAKVLGHIAGTDATPPPHVVSLPRLVADLVLLRAGLVLSVGGPPEDTANALFARAGLSTVQALGTPEPDSVRAWFQEQLASEPLELVPTDVVGGSAFNLAFLPASARQQLWLTLAVSCGVLDSPFAGPGVYRCAYRRCEKLFMSERTVTRGTLRFCSERHGKGHYAAISMQKGRERERQMDRVAEPMQTQIRRDTERRTLAAEAAASAAPFARDFPARLDAMLEQAASALTNGDIDRTKRPQGFAKNRLVVARGYLASRAALKTQAANAAASELEPAEQVRMLNQSEEEPRHDQKS